MVAEILLCRVYVHKLEDSFCSQKQNKHKTKQQSNNRPLQSRDATTTSIVSICSKCFKASSGCFISGGKLPVVLSLLPPARLVWIYLLTDVEPGVLKTWAGIPEPSSNSAVAFQSHVYAWHHSGVTDPTSVLTPTNMLTNLCLQGLQS